jgi:hypothetical protein
VLAEYSGQQTDVEFTNKAKVCRSARLHALRWLK